MNLEQRYTTAGNKYPYVSKVRELQAAIGPDGKDVTGITRGVNFLDGEVKSGPTAPDQVQNEFIRNDAGDFVYGGGGKIAGTYKLSRWLSRGIEKGDAYVNNSRFNSFKGVTIHKYNWLSERQSFVGGLQNDSKIRVNGSASGPSPRGLNG